MIPRLTRQDTDCCREPSIDLPVFYGPFIRDHFQQIDQSEHWTLLGRR